MATNYSRSRTKWRILQILFVLFATVAQCRGFVDWNSTSPDVKVGTPPFSPTDSPEDLEIYQYAIDKGGQILTADSKTQNIC